MNNYEKIKQMTVDEMAETLIAGTCDSCLAVGICKGGGCADTIKQWLLQEAK